MTKQFFKRATIALGLVALSLAGSAAPARAEFISELIRTGGTITVGDKLFSDFSYLATGDMPTAAGVNVIGITDADGNFGLRFQGGFVDLPGGGASDALIGFKVTVTDPNLFITDAHLAGNPSVLGGTGAISVTETFLPTNSNSMVIGAIGGGSTVLTASTVFATPVNVLFVQKDILAFAGTGLPALSFIDQTFSQSVPEPSSVALLMIGGVGAFGVARRRKMNAQIAE